MAVSDSQRGERVAILVEVGIVSRAIRQSVYYTKQKGLYGR
jgi:hypothetical protein